MEQWKQIPSFVRYSVSDLGRVRNDDSDRIMSLRRTEHGVVYVGLMAGSRQRKRSVGLLVATAFVHKAMIRDDFTSLIHLDGDQTNNAAVNLMWRPPWFAQRYSRQFENPRGTSKRIMEPKTGVVYNSAWEAAITHGLLERDILTAINSHTFVWPTFQAFKFVAE